MIYVCVLCGFTYQPAKGLPEDEILPATAWENMPRNWCCPDCGGTRENFDGLAIDNFVPDNCE